MGPIVIKGLPLYIMGQRAQYCLFVWWEAQLS